MEILYSKEFNQLGGQEKSAMHILTEHEVEFFRKNKCNIIKSQWLDFNELIKQLPDPYCYLSISLTNKYDYVGKLLGIVETVSTVRGPVTNTAVIKEFRSDDLIELYNMCITEAKKGIRKYNKEVLDKL